MHALSGWTKAAAGTRAVFCFWTILLTMATLGQFSDTIRYPLSDLLSPYSCLFPRS